ncbi:glutaredoxin domain-containing protein [Brevundimonas sp. AAP58]|uniref:glutaredoxin domain-containing protein n=1 Tax=Brevundimonas sp. AAP58 TaxID=1523422 RepID=UPI0009E71DA3|nr:glutaredoxin domain-containing protein [Brevundimonas sp. AAP58]
MSNLSRTAVLYRMVMPGQICPWGLRARYLLKGRGYAIDDRGLTTRDAVEAFKAERGGKSLPQIFIDGVRIGGYDDLRRYLGLKVREPESLTYTPMRWSY